MSTHIGDACRAAGLLPIAMPFSVRNSTAPGPGRIRDFRHRLLEQLITTVKALHVWLIETTQSRPARIDELEDP